MKNLKKKIKINSRKLIFYALSQHLKLSDDFFSEEDKEKVDIKVKKLLAQKANKGDAKCAYFLAQMYLFCGKDFKDYARGRDLAEKLAADNDSAGQYLMAIISYEGLGVEKNYTKAIAWAQKSASQNNHNAQSFLGFLYLKGIGCTVDEDRASDLLQKAANQGNFVAKKLYQDKTISGIDLNTVPKDFFCQEQLYMIEACIENFLQNNPEEITAKSESKYFYISNKKVSQLF